MTSYHTEIQVYANNVGQEQFDADFDVFADALYDCEGVEDADLASDSSALVYTFTMTVRVSDDLDEIEAPVQALRTALDVARTALHAGGGSTPGWTDHYHLLRQMVEQQLASEAVAA